MHRCDALNFKLTKSQKKILKKVNKFLKTQSKLNIQRSQSLTFCTENTENHLGDL